MSSADENREPSPLLAILRARLEQEGPMPVDAFMHICLDHPEHGYWRSGQTIGTGGLTLNGLWHLNGKTVQVFAGRSLRYVRAMNSIMDQPVE